MGGVEETVTVSGASPVVDVQSVARREALSRDLIDALPTGRNFQTAGATIPSVSMGRFDVGGSTAMQTTNTLVAAGSRANDTTEEVDGMGINSSLGSSSNVPVYLNNAVYEEQVYTLVGGGADVQTPGVRINLIPKSGGNQFSGSAVAVFRQHQFSGGQHHAQRKPRGKGRAPPPGSTSCGTTTSRSAAPSDRTGSGFTGPSGTGATTTGRPTLCCRMGRRPSIPTSSRPTTCV